MHGGGIYIDKLVTSYTSQGYMHATGKTPTHTLSPVLLRGACMHMDIYTHK